MLKENENISIEDIEKIELDDKQRVVIVGSDIIQMQQDGEEKKEEGNNGLLTMNQKI